MGHDVNRRQDNVLDTPFHLKFVERVYEGPPRWWASDWVKHTKRVPGTYGIRLDREPGVQNLVRMAYDYRAKYFNRNLPMLVTCVNPDCPLRTWFMVQTSATGEHSFRIRKWQVINETQSLVSFETEYTPDDRKEIQDGQAAMANGKMNDLAKCPQCGKHRPVFGFSAIKDKWVYVLKDGGSLTPHLELEMTDGSSGFIHAQFSNGQFTDKKQAFDGDFVFDKIRDHTWHFFLSPVRLGPHALSLLCQAPKQDPTYAGKRDAADPGKWNVKIIPELQPWTTTVKRSFQPRQLKTPYEFIPLVDAFSWAAQIDEFDYVPSAAAQQKLVQDSDEQAKSFISATLAQVIGRRQVSDNPPKFEEDQWSVKDETVETPDEFRSSGNIAQAWVDRYQAALLFLTGETNGACSRLFFPVRFGLGHRIVELACQENTKDPDSLKFGMMHWAHILRELLICQAGETFTVWLAKNKDAADRIPQKNVLRGEGAKAVGPALPVHLLTYLSPVVLAASDKPNEAFTKALEGIGVNATSLGKSDFVATQNLALDLPKNILDHYIAKLPKVLDPDDFHKASGLGNWSSRIQSFSTIRDVEKVIGLLASLSEFGKKGGAYQSEWDRYGKRKETLETPVKVTEFLTEKTHLMIKAGIMEETTDKGRVAAQEIVDKLEKSGIRSLTAEELQILSASRSLSAFRFVGIGVRLLAGPIGLVLGACEIIIQFGEMGHAMESGDPGAAVAHGIQAVAGILVLAVAGAECVALVTGAGAVAWAGPVGWIAAALMLVGALVMAFCAKNDLQLFARHCFLGEDWGEGGSDTTGKAWMAKNGWSSLKSHSNARIALLRMLTGFSTWIGYATYGGGNIIPSYIPTGAFFEVEVDVMPKGQTSPMETYSAVILPLDGSGGQWVWKGQKPGHGSDIVIYRSGNQVTSIHVEAHPRNLGDRPSIDYNFRVRLAYDAGGLNTLPATVKWVKNSIINMLEYSTVTSSEAEEEGEKE
jgi:hypothetical protein